jgi:probable HAF family extracellular repeat protein
VACHHVSTVRRSWSWAACLAVLVLVSTIGAFVPTIVSRLSANAIDSPDDLSLSASIVPVTFRNGDGGPYSETDDTYITSGAPGTNFGASSTLLVDGSGCKISTATVCKTLIKFPNFIGPNPGQVAPDSTIASASLDLVVTNKGVTQDVYQVTQPWGEATATWNTFSPAGAPGTKPREFAVAPTNLGLFSIDITSFVQRWADGDANEGILLASANPDGVDYDSSESANPPTLTVQFTPLSPPSPSYTAVDLGTLPGDSAAFARGINDAGQVVGASCDGTGSQCHAFLWSGGVMTDLGTLGGTYSAAFGINAAGHVVGESANATGAYHAFLWHAGAMTDLGTLGGNASSAFSINDAGQVVGWSDTEQGYLPPHHAFLWDAGAMTDLGTLGSGNTVAHRINGAIQVVGASDDEAFLWENGTMTGLGTLGCPVYSEAFGVNGAGRVVGWSADPTCDLRLAMVWQDGVMTDLGTLPGGYFSEARAINDAGQIVGESMDASGGYPAALWENGTVLSLGTLPGHNRAEAYDINDMGQIVGESTNDTGPKHAVLWTRSSGSTSYSIQDLGILSGDYHPGGRAINAAGDAVGLSYGSADDYIHGILWKDGTATYLGDLGGGQSYATAINDAGRVVGSSCKYPGDAPPACNFYYGFVWKNGTMSSLPTLFYGGTTGATGVNDGGQVVGSASALPYGYDHAAFWENGNVTDLGTLGGYYSGATAINDAGQVSGWSERSVDRLRHPFLWDGSMTDLGALPGDSEAGANAINDVGQVVGWSATTNGQSIHAFLWEG